METLLQIRLVVVTYLNSVLHFCIKYSFLNDVTVFILPRVTESDLPDRKLHLLNARRGAYPGVPCLPPLTIISRSRPWGVAGLLNLREVSDPLERLGTLSRVPRC